MISKKTNPSRDKSLQVLQSKEVLKKFFSFPETAHSLSTEAWGLLYVLYLR